MARDTLHYRRSATEALRELAEARAVAELLELSHAMWCGPVCASTSGCGYLHYPRREPRPGIPRSRRSPYNKDTADLFFLMGGGGYAAGTAKTHERDLWPVLREAAAQADAGEGARIDYTDWGRKNDTTAADIAMYTCRDTLQWAANWYGERYADQPAFLHYVGVSTVCDDLCIPPLDLVQGRFRMYGRTVGDIISALDDQGWGHDAVHALLALVRQYLFQYAEKLDFVSGRERSSMHSRLNDSAGVWDAVIYHTYSGNPYGCLLGVARLWDAGPCSNTWLTDAAICDGISMDLCKSAMGIYQLDLYQPTADEHRAQQRQTAYQSVYLDLIDDLVASGAPDALVHYAHAGFLFVQTQERYHERRIGHRIPLRPALTAHLSNIFGDEPVDPFVEQRFQAQRTSRTPLVATAFPTGPTGLGTSAARLTAHEPRLH